MRVLLVGYGTIGAAVAERARGAGAEVLVHDTDSAAASRAERDGFGTVDDPLEALARCDLVVEAAGPDAVERVVLPALAAGTRCVVMTTGALLDPRLRAAARVHRDRLVLPSGGIAGLDALRAVAHLKPSVTLETRKPPSGLGRTATEPVILFDGNAFEAWKRFPRNVNVAATLALVADVEPQVRVVADPGIRRNQHTVTVEAPGIRFSTRVDSEPSDNPQTSRLAALSAAAEVERLIRLLERP